MLRKRVKTSFEYILDINIDMSFSENGSTVHREYKSWLIPFVSLEINSANLKHILQWTGQSI